MSAAAHVVQLPTTLASVSGLGPSLGVVLAVIVLGAIVVAVGVSRRRRSPMRASGVAIDSGEPGTLESDEPREKQRSPAIRASDVASDAEIVSRLLHDVRDVLGAEEVIYWRWLESRDSLTPGAWSSEQSGRPSFFDVGAWGQLARWSAEQRLTCLSERSEGVVPARWVGATPVARADRLHGVLTVAWPGGTDTDEMRLAAKQWLPRHAAHLADVLELCERQRVAGRQMRRTQALLDAVQRLQAHTNAESLARAICDAALDVTGGRSALLVRWLEDAGQGIGHGVVQFASADLDLPPGTTIGADTLVGRACDEGTSLVLADARAATSTTPAYGPRKQLGRTGTGAVGPLQSLVVVPFRQGQRVIGAIAVEGGRPGSVGSTEAQNLGLLSAVARGSLEIVWEIEQITHQARTDQLTGLANRRHFDEQLRRVLAETDRFGGACSLILADVDHFKRVNDTHGHDAGDAVLRYVARTLQSGVRTVDVCARFGGEEIAIVLPQTSLAGAVELAERLRHEVERGAAIHHGQPIPVTASFGIASYPETVAQREQIFAAADKALYRAKSSGRNCVRTAARPNGDAATHARH